MKDGFCSMGVMYDMVGMLWGSNPETSHLKGN